MLAKALLAMLILNLAQGHCGDIVEHCNDISRELAATHLNSLPFPSSKKLSRKLQRVMLPVAIRPMHDIPARRATVRSLMLIQQVLSGQSVGVVCSPQCCLRLVNLRAPRHGPS